MLYYVLVGLIAFIIGILFGFILFSSRKNDVFVSVLNDFKKTIDEYKEQNTFNTKEVKEAIKDAQKLTKILTTNQNLKGHFGEDCLEAVLKACYPNENINYIKQVSAKNSLNQSIRPDYLLNLPNNKSVLIDCKLNLEKYIEYKENQDENLAKEKKTNLINDLNNTINILSNKEYEKSCDFVQPDFILMYIPLEPVLTLIYTDEDFISVIKNANQKNIILVGNSSVLTVIRLTKLLWTQDKSEKNIEQIIKIAQNIYNYIAQHSQNLYNLKMQFNESCEKFNKEYEKIANDNKIFKYAQELKTFGIESSQKKTGKKLTEISVNSDFLEK